jgi:hypothetical protein
LQSRPHNIRREPAEACAPGHSRTHRRAARVRHRQLNEDVIHDAIILSRRCGAARAPSARVVAVACVGRCVLCHHQSAPYVRCAAAAMPMGMAHHVLSHIGLYICQYIYSDCASIYDQTRVSRDARHRGRTLNSVTHRPGPVSWPPRPLSLSVRLRGLAARLRPQRRIRTYK